MNTDEQVTTDAAEASHTPQGKTRGTVKKKLTDRTEVAGQTIAASEEDPRYLVQSEKTGKEAAHKPDALNKV